MITIVDYGLGNLGSIQNMLKKIGAKSIISNNISEISDAEKIILPGVGSFDSAMNKINELNLKDILIKKANIDKIPFLGICLGMQILTNSSEEGSEKGLGLINAATLKFNLIDQSLKIPHMGWNTIEDISENELTLSMNEREQKFYFVHSYYVKCHNSNNVIGTTKHGQVFHSMIKNNNIYGAQFHPEKSHTFGMNLFKNFDAI